MYRRRVPIDSAMSDMVASTLDTATGTQPSTLAGRRQNGHWAVGTPSGPASVVVPQRRQASGRAAQGGEHTAEVLHELRIPPP